MQRFLSVADMILYNYCSCEYESYRWIWEITVGNVNLFYVCTYFVVSKVAWGVYNGSTC